MGILFAIYLFGQTANLQEEGKQWIDRVSRAYRDFSSYYFEGALLSEISGFQNTSQSSAFTRCAKPKENKFRYQAGMGDSKYVVACDGASTTVYYGGGRQYLRKKSTDAIAIANDVFKGETSFYLGAALPVEYSKLGAICRSIKSVKREAVNFQSARINSVVVEAELISDNSLPATRTIRTLWIDPDRLVVMRDITHQQAISMSGKVFYDSVEEVRLSSYRINEDLDDSNFQFEPPRYALLSEILNLPSSDRSLVIGPPFDKNIFIDLNGVQYSLKGLRGQVVLLDFWATWCAPCIKEMALLEKIYTRYKDKGLVVLGVDKEPDSLQRTFVKKKRFSFPMIYDRSQMLTDLFKASELPTMAVIDKQGRVVAWELGLQKEENLESLVQQLGIQ